MKPIYFLYLFINLFYLCRIKPYDGLKSKDNTNIQKNIKIIKHYIENELKISNKLHIPSEIIYTISKYYDTMWEVKKKVSMIFNQDNLNYRKNLCYKNIQLYFFKHPLEIISFHNYFRIDYINDMKLKSLETNILKSIILSLYKNDLNFFIESILNAKINYHSIIFYEFTHFNDYNLLAIYQLANKRSNMKLMLHMAKNLNTKNLMSVIEFISTLKNLSIKIYLKFFFYKTLDLRYDLAEQDFKKIDYEKKKYISNMNNSLYKKMICNIILIMHTVEEYYNFCNSMSY